VGGFDSLERLSSVRSKYMKSERLGRTTVGELIAALSKLDSDREILVRAYTGIEVRVPDEPLQPVVLVGYSVEAEESAELGFNEIYASREK